MLITIICCIGCWFVGLVLGYFLKIWKTPKIGSFTLSPFDENGDGQIHVHIDNRKMQDSIWAKEVRMDLVK
jgi:hypothetical protein